jgi:UDP-N-acetylmuramate--alanine ligase
MSALGDSGPGQFAAANEPGEAGRRPWSGRRQHFVGVGGAGMSGYARAAHALGAVVTGSDSALSTYAERLRADGVLDVQIGHDGDNLPADGDVEVIYSSAVPADNPERVAARARGLKERPRAELLGELTAMKRTIAVAGTHGKTTTAAMIVHALRTAGLQPGWLIGAPIGGGLANAEWGKGEWLVVEADESDRSMLSLHVEVGVLTNVELDHHATFGSLAELRDTFRAFLARARAAIVVWDRPELLELVGPAVSAGVEQDEEGRGIEGRRVELVPYAIAEPRRGEGGEGRRQGGEGREGDEGGEPRIAGRTEMLQRFAWRGREVALKVPGAHNALNATAALEVARLAGADADRAIAGLAAFTGAGRRFQLVGKTTSGAVVYDDYAHHPTEVAATLTAARTLDHRRVVAVFQPHLYSRTALLARELGLALALADVVVVLDVYPARERAEDHPGVSGLLIAEAAADAAHGKPVYWLPGFAEAEAVLKGVLVEGDICLVMGAGDIDGLGRRLVGEEEQDV